MGEKVSIIVPCYCQAEYLPETLDSVMAQSYENWECVIVNDGSPDNTEDVAQAYCQRDNRFKYVYQSNQGLAVARNTGVAHSNGTFILPLDSDDWIDATYVEKAVKCFEREPGLKLVYCKAALFGAETGLWDLPEYHYHKLLWKNCIFCTAMYRKVDYEKTRGYNPNMRYGFEDWDFWLSLLSETDRVCCLDEPLFHYRVKESSMLKDLKDSRLEATYIQIYNNHKALYEPFMTDYQERIIYVRELLLEKKNLERELSNARDEIDRLHATRAYNLGKSLLKPFSIFKRKP